MCWFGIYTYKRNTGTPVHIKVAVTLVTMEVTLAIIYVIPHNLHWYRPISLLVKEFCNLDTSSTVVVCVMCVFLLSALLFAGLDLSKLWVLWLFAGLDLSKLWVLWVPPGNWMEPWHLLWTGSINSTCRSTWSKHVTTWHTSHVGLTLTRGHTCQIPLFLCIMHFHWPNYFLYHDFANRNTCCVFSIILICKFGLQMSVVFPPPPQRDPRRIESLTFLVWEAFPLGCRSSWVNLHLKYHIQRSLLEQ